MRGWQTRVRFLKLALMRTFIRNRIVTSENSSLSILDGVLVEHDMLVSEPLKVLLLISEIDKIETQRKDHTRKATIERHDYRQTD